MNSVYYFHLQNSSFLPDMRGQALQAQLSMRNEDLSMVEMNADAMCVVMRKMFQILKDVWI